MVWENLWRVQAAAEILGKVRGERVAMLVHHSRNSVQKQWEETLVLALGGMARILRAHLAILVPMSGFSQVAALAPPLCIALIAVPLALSPRLLLLQARDSARADKTFVKPHLGKGIAMSRCQTFPYVWRWPRAWQE